MLAGDAVLRELVDDVDTRSLHPILLTGSTLVCQDDLVIPLLSEMQRLINAERWDVRLHRSRHSDLSAIEGDGVDWNSRTYVLFVQELLLRGITRCLLADRALVREGWELTRINTVIDVSSNAEQLFLNQRGALSERPLDPARMPIHFWTIIAHAPDDLSDLHNWMHDAGTLFGPADDGVIEQGIGHYDPVFESCVDNFAPEQLIDANEGAFVHAARRSDLEAQWSAAAFTSSVPVVCADICIPEQLPHAPERPQRERLVADTARYIERKQSQRMFYTLWGVLAIGIGMSSVLFLPFHNGPYLAGASALAYFAYVVIHASRLRKMRPVRITTSARTYLSLLATAVFIAMREAGDVPESTKESDIRISDRGRNRVRVALSGVGQQHAQLYAESFLAVLAQDTLSGTRLALTTLDVTHVTLNDAARLPSFAGLRIPAGSLGIPPAFRTEPLRVKAFRAAVETVLGGTVNPDESTDLSALAPALVAESFAMPVVWL